MRTIKISDIKIENRQRRHFDEKALIALAESIQKKGLLHPVVLQDDEKTLVAGERRCRAVAMLAELFTSITHDGQTIPEGSIAYVTLRELSEDDLVEAELEENILRENLTWQEESDAIARLHELRVGQIPNQTYKDTATEIAGDKASSATQVKVRDSIIIRQYLDDPDVAKAKSAKERPCLKLQKDFPGAGRASSLFLFFFFVGGGNQHIIGPDGHVIQTLINDLLECGGRHRSSVMGLLMWLVNNHYCSHRGVILRGEAHKGGHKRPGSIGAVYKLLGRSGFSAHFVVVQGRIRPGSSLQNHHMHHFPNGYRRVAADDRTPLFRSEVPDNVARSINE